jgi:hypothetical protein
MPAGLKSTQQQREVIFMPGVVRVAGWLRIAGVDDESNRSVVKSAGWIALVAMLIRIVFWLYTQRYWEDALITCLHAENMASGLGLTHVRPGEPPLHGFTSPLSVLVPLIGDLMHVGFGVEFLKLVSIPASALTVLFVLGICIHPKVRLSTPLAIIAMGFAAVEHHQILWGMAGMETQLAVLILIMSVYYTMTLNTVPLGISLGLCMLVRPDYAFWTVISGVYVLFNRPRAFLPVTGIALAVYLPWILFTLLYYGSPIPNTVLAKGLGYTKWYQKVPELSFFAIKRHTWLMMAEQLHVHLGPMFAGHGASVHLFFTKGAESPIANFMFGFSVIGTLTIFFKRQWVLWPLVAVVVVYSLYYVYVVPVVFGWYKMPYILTLLLLSLRGLQWAGEWIKNVKWRGRWEGGFAAVYLGLFISVLPISFYTERLIQQYVENDVRMQAGLYLKEHMKPDEAVGCEPLGYMSYYSRGNVYDWPGLANRKVVAWSESQPPERRSLENMVKDLKPEYLFLRDIEVLYFFKSNDWLKEAYHVEKVFQVDPEIAPAIPWLDRNMDTVFRIYKKNHPDDPQPYDNSLFPSRRDSGATPPQ